MSRGRFSFRFISRSIFDYVPRFAQYSIIHETNWGVKITKKRKKKKRVTFN